MTAGERPDITNSTTMAASPLLLALLFAIQVAAVRPSADIELDAIATPASLVMDMEAAPPYYGDPAVNKAGWVAVTGTIRTATNTGGKSQIVPVKSSAAITAPTRQIVLAVRPELEAVKYGREASRSTTIPPPAL